MQPKKEQQSSSYKQESNKGKQISNTGYLYHYYSQIKKLVDFCYPEQEKNLVQRTNAQNLILSSFTGALSGVSISYMSFPLEAMKKWSQAGLDKYAKKSLKPEDQLRWYRGSLIFALNIVPTTMLQYSFRQFSKPWVDENNTLQSIIAAFLCGVVGAPTATVVERAVVYQQKLKIDKIIPAFKAMYHEGGARGLFRSLPVIAARDGGFTTWMFMVNPIIAKKANDKFGERYSLLIQLITACAFGATLTHPVDAIGTEMQASSKQISIKDATLSLWNKTDPNHSIQRRIFAAYGKGLVFRWALFPFYATLIPALDNFFKRKVDSVRYQNGTLAKHGLFNYKEEPRPEIGVSDNKQVIDNQVIDGEENPDNFLEIYHALKPKGH